MLDQSETRHQTVSLVVHGRRRVKPLLLYCVNYLYKTRLFRYE